MSAWIKASVLVFTQGIEATLIYRLALVQTIVVEFIAYGGIAAYWFHAAQSNSSVFNRRQILVYFAIAWLMQLLHYNNSTNEISSDIRLGRLSYSIVRPFPYLLQSFLRSAAYTTFNSFCLGTVMLGVIWYFGVVDLAAYGGLFVLAVLLGLMVGELLRTSIGLLAFHMTQVWGPATLLLALYFATSGASYPPNLLPAPYDVWVTFSPTYYMVGFPALILLGKLSVSEITTLFVRGGVLALGLALLVNVQWRRGIRNFEGVGI